MTDKNPLQKRATMGRIWRLFAENVLPIEAWDDAQARAGFIPSPADWRTFADRLMLILGTVFLLAGIFFFFAFNWSDLPRLGQFFLLQTAVVIAAALAYVLGLDTWGGRVSLLMASGMVGVTMAVVGQAYQSGADSYRLFLIWTLLITGWVLISRWNAMWLMWVALVNTTLLLYWAQVIGDDSLNVAVALSALLNAGVVIGWDALERAGAAAFLRDRWAQYVIALPALGFSAFLMLDLLFMSGSDSFFAPFLYGGIVFVFGGYYSSQRHDLFMLTLTALSGLAVSVAIIGWFFSEIGWADADPVSFLFIMGVITVGITTGLVFLLRGLNRLWEGESA